VKEFGKSIFLLCLDNFFLCLFLIINFPNRLNGTYIPPKPRTDLPPAQAGQAKRGSILSGVFGGGGGNSASPSPSKPKSTDSAAHLPPLVPQLSTERSTAMVSIDQQTVMDDNEDRMTMTPTDSAPLNANQLMELSKETIVNDFLVCSVTKGDMIAKKKEDSRRHHGYLATIRIRYFEEIEREDKTRFDQNAYNNISLLPAKSILKVFDGYRSLKVSLEEKDVFSLDREKQAKDKVGAVLIAAFFPKTYARSSLGLGLGENEIRTRTAELNYWFGRLLVQYSELSPEAQEMVNEFLELDEENPAEPENVFILQM
jgi:hypothetical protein